MSTLQIIGGGQMGRALLGGLLRSGTIDPTDISVVEIVGSQRSALSEAFPEIECREEIGPSESAVIAVKPPDAPAVAAVAARAGALRLLSIAAGVTLEQLEGAAPDRAVIRAMPNTPALVGHGVTALAGGAHADPEDLDWAEQILGGVGEVVRVPESSLDAVTGLSGSGPAYVFLVAEALVEAGVLAGLPRATAELLTFHTLHGAAHLLLDTPRSPADLRAAVTSPGGTTAAGLRELERAGLRAAFLEAVDAAASRSRELGRPSPTAG